MKRSGFMLLLLIVIGPILWADIFSLRNGIILVGKIIGLNEGYVEIEVYGTKIKLAVDEILRTESNFSSLKGKTIDIELKDKTIIKGKFQDYDPDIGFLFEIDFGVITVPLTNIKKIEDPLQKQKSLTEFVTLGFGGG